MKRESGRIKVFVIDDPRLDGVGWWRNCRPFVNLDKQYGDILEIVNVGENVDIRALMTADVVVRFRPVTGNSLNFLKLCKELGLKIIIDIDDDLWHIPPGHPVFGDSITWRDRLHETYSLADTIWTSTEQLRYVVGDLNRAEVMQNAILPEELPDAPLPWKSTACWRGNDKQVADVLSDHARYWYDAAKDKYDHWLFAGYLPPLPHGPNARFVPGKDVLSYFLSLRQGMANVFWKPLQENLFNDSKSNIAWLEATMSGGVCVTNYSGKPGWEFAMPHFPTDPEEVEIEWNLSKSAIIENYNLLKVNERRLGSIMRLVGWETMVTA